MSLFKGYLFLSTQLFLRFVLYLYIQCIQMWVLFYFPSIVFCRFPKAKDSCTSLWRILSCNIQHITFPCSLDSPLCIRLLNSMYLTSFYPGCLLTAFPSVLLLMCSHSWVISLQTQFSKSPSSDFILFVSKTLNLFLFQFCQVFKMMSLLL